MHTHIPPDALDKFKAGDIAAALVDFENVSALEVCVCGGGEGRCFGSVTANGSCAAIGGI